MKLVKIFFDAYRSLLKKELEINEDCIGLVGSNESGKSNIILAISILSEEKHLTVLDTPKMDKSKNPALRFKFALNENEINEINAAIKQWQEINTLYYKEIKIPTEITYNITFDKDSEEESRYFTIDNVKVDSNLMFLKYDKINQTNCKILFENKYRNIKNAIIISQINLEKDKTLLDSKELEILINEIENEQKLLMEIKIPEEKQTDLIDPNIQNPTVDQIEADTKSKEIIKKIEVLKQKKEAIEKRIADYNIFQLTNVQANLLVKYKSTKNNKETEKSAIIKKISDLEKISPQTEEQKIELLNLKKISSNLSGAIEEIIENTIVR